MESIFTDRYLLEQKMLRQEFTTSAQRKERERLKAEEMNLQKENAWRSQTYLDWVKLQPCGICSAVPAGDAHHLRGLGKLGGAKLKAPDQFAMPLCRSCHMEMHRNPSLWDQQWEMIARTLGLAIQEGILVEKKIA